MSESSAAYRTRIATIHQELGIPADYAEARGLPLQVEAIELVDTEPDLYGRQPLLTPVAFHWWRRMRDAAADDGVVLYIVSAFRSVEYQVELLRNKLAKGQAIREILEVNAAPGYSEHHTGRALDLATDLSEPLTESFEDTAAYTWLEAHAQTFHFALSYPRQNPHGIAYEPWHWICGAG